ncbi:MAG: 3-hydroxyacyl-ACP dehydratase FabZ [Aestuariivirgaceae bacterium]
MPDNPGGHKLGEADIKRVMQLLPHRYPFLLLDRIIEMNGEESAVGIKNVTFNEPFFQGHFPGSPIMPGVLLIEAMAQTAGALVINHLGPDQEGKLVYFMSIDKARFRRPVLPGHQVRFPVRLIQKRPPVWRFAAEAIVDGKQAAEAEIGAMLMESGSQA